MHIHIHIHKSLKEMTHFHGNLPEAIFKNSVSRISPDDIVSDERVISYLNPRVMWRWFLDGVETSCTIGVCHRLREVCVRTCDGLRDVCVRTCHRVCNVCVRTRDGLRNVCVRTCDRVCNVCVCTCDWLRDVCVHTWMNCALYARACV